MAITKITTGVISLNAVTATIVAENVITSSELATNAVDTLQITNEAVTSAKLDTNIDVAGTLDVTGVLTADSNVVIAGNLTVNGTTVTNSATNTTIEDALIELGTGTSGTPANDAGIIIERGSAANAFIGFDESADKFIVATTTATGSSTGDLTLTAAPLVTGALTASGLSYPTSDGSSAQVIQTDGSGNLSFGTVITGGAVVHNYTATGDGSTATFDTGINPQDEVNTWVHIDGVYQNKSEYSYNGTSITFTSAPDSGAAIDIISGTQNGFSTADSVLGVYTATTTDTATYDTGLSASTENNVNIFIEGVYQPKSTYTWSGSTITFDANTPVGLSLEVIASKTLTSGAVVTASIADDAVTAAKLASNSVVSASIVNNSITGADISATTSIVASTFTGNLVGNVTGNVVGNVTGTLQTAAQGNITSVGTLTGLDVAGTPTFDGLTAEGAAVNINMLETNTTDVNTRLRLNSGDFIIQTLNDAQNAVTSRLAVDNATGDISFYEDTGSTAKLFWDASAESLGIGTSSPEKALHIKSTSNQLRLQDSTNDKKYDLNVDGNNFSIDDMSAGASRFTIKDGGNVGIGTSSPAQPLTVNGGVFVTNDLNSPGSAGSYTYNGTAIDYASNGARYWSWGSSSARGTFDFIQLENDGTNQQTAMTIDSSGKVGIGTSTPIENLDVSGYQGISVNNNYAHMGSTVSGAMAIFGHNIKSDSGGNTIKSANTGYHSSMIKMYYNEGITFHATSGTTTAGDVFYNVSGTTNELMRITNSGNVGIGTINTNSFKTYIDASSGKGLFVGAGDGGYTALGFDGDGLATKGSLTSHDGKLYIGSENTSGTGSNGELMVVPGTGNIMTLDGANAYVGIGTTNPSSKLQIMGGTSGVDQISLSSNLSDNTTKYAGLIMTMYTNNTAALIGAKAENGNTSLFYGSSGSDHRGVTKHIWYTNSNYNATSGNTERMRLTSAGILLFKKTDSSVNVAGGYIDGGECIMSTTSGANTYLVRNTSNSTYSFYVGGDGEIHSTNTSITSLSDERLKENIVDLETGLSEVMSLKPRRFDWKEGEGSGKKNLSGFIAQEVETVLPDLIDDFMHDDIDDAKSVKMGDMIPTLVKAIQEQQTIIDDLKSRIEALEG